MEIFPDYYDQAKNDKIVLQINGILAGGYAGRAAPPGFDVASLFITENYIIAVAVRTLDPLLPKTPNVIRDNINSSKILPGSGTISEKGIDFKDVVFIQPYDKLYWAVLTRYSMPLPTWTLTIPRIKVSALHVVTKGFIKLGIMFTLKETDFDKCVNAVCKTRLKDILRIGSEVVTNQLGFAKVRDHGQVPT